MSSLFGALSGALSAAQKVVSGSQPHTRSLQKEIRIKSLHLHPIKSCAGSSVAEAEITQEGFKYDRTWLIIDAKDKKFCTARGTPHIVRIKPMIDSQRGVLVIEVPASKDVEADAESTTLEVPLDPSNEELSRAELVSDVEIWGFLADGYAVSKEADDALTKFMGKPVRLVRKGPKVRPGGLDDPRGEESKTSFQDFHSLTVASAESLEHVQKTLVASVYPERAQAGDMKVGTTAVECFTVPGSLNREFWTEERLSRFPIERFRINIILESAGNNKLDPWEEDGFKRIEAFPASQASHAPFGPDARGNGVGIHVNAKCGRCLVPSVDLNTGKRDPHIPYLVLQKFRQVQPELKKVGKPCFGVLSSPAQNTGSLRVGDVVRVVSTVDPDTRPLTK
ncbi:hypothetical protein IE81DRAFT_322458 [Ceraceosorus guamensis]|uniref:MOSC domain-containing protein n=1 Tax=Ceraceosorus guamensis TaxID=1522189 RepID=A0A316W0Z5_9BASI|nr:hypothetical protein IE81DRAFT_322458 [Ceraceosorus guamensis]PWN43392.1 hypothetical protein IE81DRAFT_322458 [Ceraceosorus guamensis]